MISTFDYVKNYTYDYRQFNGDNALEIETWLIELDSGISVFLKGVGMIYDPSEGVASPFLVRLNQYLIVNLTDGGAEVSDTIDHLSENQS